MYVTHERPDAENTLAGHVPNYRVCWPSSYSKRWQSPHCNSYREEKEGGWACRTGEVYSLHERTEERENWMKERRDILTLYWKTSLLIKTNSHCWLRTALQQLQCILIILWKYLNKRRTGAEGLSSWLLTFGLRIPAKLIKYWQSN